MTTGRPSPVIQLLRRAALAQDAGRRTDGELLGGFVARRDGDALEALIRRHGPMVLAVCRRVLGNESDAEDAFQAAFLVFVRKAASIRARELVGNWLYGVAYRTALKARSAAARRRAKERRAATMTPTRVDDEEDWAELLPLLDRELSRLPEKYRVPIVLCELEGRSRKEAAGKLGVPEGTLSSRLATGRRMLARRLAPHKTGSAGCGLGAALARASAGADVPPPLLASTAKAASLFTAGRTATAVVSARVAALAEGVLKTMLLMKLAVGFLAAVAVVATGAVVFACRPPAPSAQTPPTDPLPARAALKDKAEINEVKSDWGEAVDGVQARIRTPKTVWKAGEAPTFILDLRNRGKKTPNARRVAVDCQIEVDGTWYSFMFPSGPYPSVGDLLEPGKQVNDWTVVSPDKNWRSFTGKKEDFSLAPGKHTVRIAYPLGGVTPGIRPVSGPLEIEVGKESAWGDADGGVPARIRTPKAEATTEEDPALGRLIRSLGAGPIRVRSAEHGKAAVSEEEAVKAAKRAVGADGPSEKAWRVAVTDREFMSGLVDDKPCWLLYYPGAVSLPLSFEGKDTRTLSLYVVVDAASGRLWEAFTEPEAPWWERVKKKNGDVVRLYADRGDEATADPDPPGVPLLRLLNARAQAFPDLPAGNEYGAQRKAQQVIARHFLYTTAIDTEERTEKGVRRFRSHDREPVWTIEFDGVDLPPPVGPPRPDADVTPGGPETRPNVERIDGMWDATSGRSLSTGMSP